MLEEWKQIDGFEYYMISNLGRVKSVERETDFGLRKKIIKEKILKNIFDGNYYKVVLNGKSIRVHLLVWDAFGYDKRDSHKLLVDHKDENKLNNRIDNLQLLNSRDNVNKSYKLKNKYSKYEGVTYHKYAKKWMASCRINGKKKYLGYFNNEEDAYKKYIESIS